MAGSSPSLHARSSKMRAEPCQKLCVLPRYWEREEGRCGPVNTCQKQVQNSRSNSASFGGFMILLYKLGLSLLWLLLSCRTVHFSRRRINTNCLKWIQPHSQEKALAKAGCKSTLQVKSFWYTEESLVFFSRLCKPSVNSSLLE